MEPLSGYRRASRGETICLPMIVFGVRGHSLPCCPRSNAFETTTRTYRHPANGTESENGKTDGRTNRSIVLCPLGRGGIINDEPLKSAKPQSQEEQDELASEEKDEEEEKQRRGLSLEPVECQCQCQSKFFSVAKIEELLRSPQRRSRVTIQNQEMIVEKEVFLDVDRKQVEMEMTECQLAVSFKGVMQRLERSSAGLTMWQMWQMPRASGLRGASGSRENFFQPVSIQVI